MPAYYMRAMDADRELIRSLVEQAANGRPTRWADDRTLLKFEERDWTLEVFDVPSDEELDFHRRLGAIHREVRARLGQSFIVVTHTPEDTSRYFDWVRA